jgi:hypothetical protein
MLEETEIKTEDDMKIVHIKKFCLKKFILRLLGFKRNVLKIEYSGILHIDESGIGIVLGEDVTVYPETYKRVKLDSCFKINEQRITNWEKDYPIHTMEFLTNHLMEIRETEMFYGAKNATCFLHNKGIYETSYKAGTRIAFVSLDLKKYDEIIITLLP